MERGADQLYNYVAELAASGLELAEVRARGQETNARVELDSLARIGVIGPERRLDCNACASYAGYWCTSMATATAEQVHEAAGIIANEFIPFYDANRDWISRGFSPSPELECRFLRFVVRQQ